MIREQNFRAFFAHNSYPAAAEAGGRGRERQCRKVLFNDLYPDLHCAWNISIGDSVLYWLVALIKYLLDYVYL